MGRKIQVQLLRKREGTFEKWKNCWITYGHNKNIHVSYRIIQY